MTRDDLALVMDKVFNECRELRNQGQAEYARRDDNAFANFERIAERMGTTREAVLLTYAEKHLDGIHAYVSGHKSQRESVKGRINDLIVYMILLRGMVEEGETPCWIDPAKEQAAREHSVRVGTVAPDGTKVAVPLPYTGRYAGEAK